ncbi:MAG: amidohydrolase family protein [Gemmataceae bacterium]
MQRRAFLLAGAGWTAANALAADDQRSLAIVDTHTHFYDPTRPQGVPWPGKGDRALYRPVLPDEFKRLARPLGVVGTVVVEASPWVEDNGWLLDLAAKDPFLLGVVGRLDPAADTFDAHLRRFARNPLYRGIRIGHDDLRAGLEGKLVKRCQRLIDHDLTVDVNGGPDLPADVARLAARLPKLRIVVNHAANLKIDGRPVPPAGATGCARRRGTRTSSARCRPWSSRPPAPHRRATSTITGPCWTPCGPTSARTACCSAATGLSRRPRRRWRRWSTSSASTSPTRASAPLSASFTTMRR